MSPSAQKVVVKVSIDADLVTCADRAGTDISQAAEAGIRQAVKMDSAEREALRKAWKAENAEAIRSYNDYIRENGLPLAKYRMF